MIETQFIGTANSAERAAVTAPVQRWQSIIVGDLPNSTIDIPASTCFDGQPAVSATIDDIRIQVFIDSIEVPLLYHFGGLKSVLPIGVLESIEFYPGNFSPVYGRATGGIIDVRIKDLKPEKMSGYADVSILDTGVYLEMPIGKNAAIALAGRRSYIDAILNAVVPDDAGVSLQTAPVYYDYQLVGSYRPTPV